MVLYTCLFICLITTQLDNAFRSVGTLHARQQGQKYLNGVKQSCSQSTTSNFDRGLVRVHPEERVIRDGLGRHTMHATKVVFIAIEHFLFFSQVVKKGSFGDLLMGRDLKALRIDIPLLLARSRGRRLHSPVPHRAQGQYRHLVRHRGRCGGRRSLDVEAMSRGGLWLQGLDNLLAKFLGDIEIARWRGFARG